MSEKGGFTLLELILVMVIISILAGTVVISVAGKGTEARIVRARADLSTYQQAIESYAIQHEDKYPKSLNELVSGKKKYVMQIKKDGWGNPYVFRVPGKGQSYDLFSTGPDEQAGTADDISIWDDDWDDN